MSNNNSITNENIFDAITRKGVICFVDTCFLMNPRFLEEFYDSVTTYNSLHKYPIKLRIIPSVIAELQKKEKVCNDFVADKARRALNIVERDGGKSLVIYDINSNTRHSDACLLATVLLERVKRPVCVFTQDKALQQDVYAMTQLASCKGHNLSVMCFSGGQELCSKYTYEAPRFESKYYKFREKEMIA